MRKEQNIKICLTILIAIIISVLLFWITFRDISKHRNDDYTIKFYEGNQMLQEVKHHKNDYVTQNELDEIIKLVSNTDNNYYLSWSLSKSIFEEVDFTTLNQNANVYLFRFRNEFKVSVVETGQFDYEILQDGPIIYGSNTKIKIMPKSKFYKPTVFANGKEVYSTEEGIYEITQIKKDVVVEVTLKEIITSSPVENVIYSYDGTMQEFKYVLKNHQNEIITSDEIAVTYFYKGKKVNAMCDAGEYEVKLYYTGEKYYFETVFYKVTMNKVEPVLDLENPKYKYNGNNQSIEKDNIVTNSDGEISFVNNSFKEVGIHNVIVNIEESNNYLSLTKTVQVEVIKGNPKIMEYPQVAESFYGDTLEDIELIGGGADVEGTFFWLNPKEHLYDKTSKCYACFVPKDIDNYNYAYILLDINTISIQEMLERIKIDKEETIAYLENVDLSKETQLPIKANRYNADITWLSSTTAYQVGKDGQVTITDEPGEYVVNLVGVLTFRNVAEYVNLTFMVSVTALQPVEIQNNQNTLTLAIDNINISNFNKEIFDYQFN